MSSDDSKSSARTPSIPVKNFTGTEISFGIGIMPKPVQGPRGRCRRTSEGTKAYPAPYDGNSGSRLAPELF
jgi:hypothetical protein